jgi:hypothetical protein
MPKVYGPDSRPAPTGSPSPRLELERVAGVWLAVDASRTDILSDRGRARSQAYTHAVLLSRLHPTASPAPAVRVPMLGFGASASHSSRRALSGAP